MTEKVLVTGSAGHLGEALMRTLRERGTPAVGLDVLPSAFTDQVGSIGDRGLVRRCLDGVSAVIHAATLHKPHLATHGRQQFIDVNVAGTLVLLEAAAAAGVRAFVFTSTTSAFGAALRTRPGEPAAWITEDVAPVARNIYGVSKLAAEGLCELFARREGLPTVVLRTSRFFPEVDDDPAVRDGYAPLNAQANELAYRRADLADVVDAHLRALACAPRLGFGRYVISATTPFERGDAPDLGIDAAAAVARRFPDFAELYAARGWRMFPRLDRVYDNAAARAALDWRPRYDFRHVLACLADGQDFRSPLARTVGAKGYHAEAFDEGPYPVA